ncbi:putative GntR-family transcriptional regulatory protein [Marinomonas sp. MED121]|uniref:histidine utilization repressor n=1 Tax=Marinomonas sp. MED121 TaxID=314277 RepID=UPI0000690251|nr:histidine utilization repressor [Marinomonas sp. MED121]EAQ63479.1 putative GntR-family transcriptional regulatory protein [Marinomonas sp. MED121]
MVDTATSMMDSLSKTIEDSPAPIYARVKQAICHKINSGEWQADQRVPSESEMVKALSVSRMTVNRALRELTDEGVLVRQQGVGTFVAQKKAHSALFEVHNIADEIAARGHTHKAQLIEITRAKANMEEAMNLGVRTNHSIFRATILHFENELPIQIEERVVNASLAPDYDKQDFQLNTAYDYLMKVAPMTEGEHLVEAVIASPKECELLAINASEPCLQIKRRTWSKDKLVTTARLLSPGSRFQLFGHFGR